MSNIAIRAEKLSKMYKLGVRRNHHDTLRDQLVYGVKSFFSRNGRRSRPSSNSPSLVSGPRPSVDGRSDSFWALKDASFEIGHGEVVGFIGRNGAGKSTLLKILSRITEPTSGRAEIFGRVGSLLEVGTGFHGELTGRENIFLSGAILGMKRWEIETKFDQVVDFSEIAKFIDTPVKRYSSGMYVRLAFAVAAHLEPEILIVDEVLAVGDASFRLKCMDKMEEIRAQGRTILLVSHSAEAITRICSGAYHLDGGKIVASGTPQDVLPNYFATIRYRQALHEWPDNNAAPGNEIVRLSRARVRNRAGETADMHDIRQPLGIEMEYQVLKPGYLLVPVFRFCNEEGLVIFMLQDVDSRWRRNPRPVGRCVSTAWLPGNFFAEGRLAVDVAMMSHTPSSLLHFNERSAVGFQIVDSHDGDSARGDFKGPIPGLVRPVVEWTTDITEEVEAQPTQRMH